jgi:hypothetical protein
LKTKRRRDTGTTVNLVGCDPVLFERVRASLRRGPLHFVASPKPLPPDRVDVYATPAGAVGDLPGTGVPVMAWGPSGGLRSAFLSGCEDYLREPWSPEELELRALRLADRARRGYSFPWGEASFDGDTLLTPGGTVCLTRHESVILHALLRSRGSPVAREALFLLAWGRPGPAGSRAVDMHVAGVRRKVRAAVPAAGRFISCVRGQGYMVS